MLKMETNERTFDPKTTKTKRNMNVKVEVKLKKDTYFNKKKYFKSGGGDLETMNTIVSYIPKEYSGNAVNCIISCKKCWLIFAQRIPLAERLKLQPVFLSAFCDLYSNLVSKLVVAFTVRCTIKTY